MFLSWGAIDRCDWPRVCAGPVLHNYEEDVLVSNVSLGTSIGANSPVLVIRATNRVNES